MQDSKFFSVVLKLLLLTTLLPVFAQKNKTKKGELIRKEEFVDSTVHEDKYLYFKNLNRIAYYYDKSRANHIQKLDKSKDWEKLFPVLRNYVYHFGIENFYKDTYWIWRLAKLTELYGDMNEAKALYKLVLKHHRADIDIKKIELYFDSLTANDKDYYVPIEYYYELVEYRKAIDTLRPPRGVLLNMGQVINSKYGDYGPVMGIRNDILYFTSKRNLINVLADKVENEDLYFSQNYDGYWDKAQPMKGVNSRYNEGSCCISNNGKKLFFSRCEAPDGFGNCDIYQAELLPDSTWGNVKNLGINVNSKAWDSQPALSRSEDTLFFSSDRIGGFGLSDIYYSVKQKNGDWGPAKNIGPVLNTRNNEVSPFFHHFYNVLYFSSNGHILNFGDYDIYKSNLVNGHWQEPKNIGPLVNGKGFEYYFTIDPESSRLFYSKSDQTQKQNLDLYSFPLPMEAQPTAVTKLTGSLTDSLTGRPYKGIVSIIDLDHGIEVAPKNLRPDGSFEFDLIDRNNYLLVIQGDEYFRIEEVFFLNGDMDIDKVTRPLERRIKFQSVEFEEGEYAITTEMYTDLNKVINFLTDNPEFKLRISGHTDSAGDKDFNLKLSQKRADSIRDFIVLTGDLDEKRIEAKGYGDTKPIVTETSDEDRKINRRVEFEIYREGKGN
jgi:outer membrane protein OmpA-like peptidoglycan-associated protein